MTKINLNRAKIIKSLISDQLNIEVIQKTIGVKNLKSAQYLRLIYLIESFVLSLMDSFSLNIYDSKKTELGLHEIKTMLNYKDLRSVKIGVERIVYLSLNKEILSLSISMNLF